MFLMIIIGILTFTARRSCMAKQLFLVPDHLRVMIEHRFTLASNISDLTLLTTVNKVLVTSLAPSAHWIRSEKSKSKWRKRHTYLQYLVNSSQFQISVISECNVKHLGDLPFNLQSGTCRTFMIDPLPTILLCFFGPNSTSKCRSLTRKKHGALSDIRNFILDSQFDVDKNVIPNSKHDHLGALLANYQGFPLILGASGEEAHNKLETLNAMESPFRWVEGPDYPYSTV